MERVREHFERDRVVQAFNSWQVDHGEPCGECGLAADVTVNILRIPYGLARRWDDEGTPPERRRSRQMGDGRNEPDVRNRDGHRRQMGVSVSREQTTY